MDTRSEQTSRVEILRRVSLHRRARGVVESEDAALVQIGGFRTRHHHVIEQKHRELRGVYTLRSQLWQKCVGNQIVHAVEGQNSQRSTARNAEGAGRQRQAIRSLRHVDSYRCKQLWI